MEAFRRDPRSLGAVSAHYDAALRSTDRSVTRFLERLKKRGLWDKTLVIVTADHGELLGEHGLLGHTEGLYEPVLRVPLYVRHPRLPGSAGARIKALVERVDLPPTFLDAAGVDAAGMELQGQSLVPLLKNPSAPWRKFAYASSKRNMSVISDWLIDERALREERDLASVRPEIVARLSFELQNQAERARTHAPGTPSGRTVEEPSGLLLPTHD